MDDLSVLEWATGGAVAIVFGALGYVNSRVTAVEKQIYGLFDSIRKDHEKGIADVWVARDRDRDQREKDQETSAAFRQYVLTHLATKEDFNALETRITGAVRMIVNERQRRGDINGSL